MATKNNTINGRLQLKHDIEVNWNQATGFIPLAGELIVYDPDANYDYSRVKIGDGIKTVIALPFIDKTKVNRDEITLIYQQDEEPEDALIGALWIDTNEDPYLLDIKSYIEEVILGGEW